jgi:putative salt-induced outer membrane protein YdiY
MRVLVLLLLLGAPAAADDEVTLKSGEKVVGTITGMKGGKLEVSSPQLGTVKVPWEQVASIKSDGSFKFRLTTGENLEGKFVVQDGRMKIMSAGAGTVEVELGAVSSLNEPPMEWHGFVDLGGRATDGNNHASALQAAFECSRVSEVDEMLVRGIYRVAADGDRVIVERNSYGLGRYAYKVSEELFAFATIELFSDRFRDLSLRTVVGAGLGWKLLHDENIDISLEAGIAFTDNDFRIAKDESHVGGRASAHLRLALPLGFELVDDFTIYPNFEESQDFQFHNEASLSRGLGGGWTIRGGVVSDYDREPSPGLHRHDDTYFISVGYKF